MLAKVLVLMLRDSLHVNEIHEMKSPALYKLVIEHRDTCMFSSGDIWDKALTLINKGKFGFAHQLPHKLIHIDPSI